MFGFLKSRKDPLADARSAERWFAAPVVTDPLSRKQELIEELARITAPTAKLTPRRLGALFVVDAHAEQLFRALTAQYVEHANRSAKIERQYRMTIVLQLIDTGNLSARQIEQVWSELDGWCASLRLSLEPKTVTSFFVDLASREGLKRRTSAALEGSVLFVDTQPLHAA